MAIGTCMFVCVPTTFGLCHPIEVVCVGYGSWRASGSGALKTRQAASSLMLLGLVLTCAHF